METACKAGMVIGLLTWLYCLSQMPHGWSWMISLYGTAAGILSLVIYIHRLQEDAERRLQSLKKHGIPDY